jgi:hypothetical protein
MKYLLTLLTLAALTSACSKEAAPPPDPFAVARTETWAMSTAAVKERLKSPSTAAFPALPDSFAVSGKARYRRFDADSVKFKIDTGFTKATVEGWVDSQNGFGAMIRGDFLVTLERLDTASEWVVEAVDIR